MLRIGHKGADAIVPGNTVASFRAAAEVGVDAIEFDVLRPPGDFADDSNWRRAAAGPSRGSGPLLVAHDWGAAARGEPPTLEQALDAFTEPPLAGLRFDLDLKIRGREDEIVAALAERGLTDRAMVSGMEVETTAWLRDNAPQLARGWTIPKVGRDWSRSRLLRPVFLAGSASYRARLPGIVRRQAGDLDVWAVWVFHRLITARLLAAAHSVGVEVIAWTVDDAARIAELERLGVDGVVTNDPRLFS